MNLLDFNSADSLVEAVLGGPDDDLGDMSFKDLETSIEATRVVHDDENVTIISLLDEDPIKRYAKYYPNAPAVFSIAVIPKKDEGGVRHRNGVYGLASWSFTVAQTDNYITAVKNGRAVGETASDDYHGFYEYPYSVLAAKFVSATLVSMQKEIGAENFMEVLLLTTDGDELNELLENGALKGMDPEVLGVFRNDMVVKMAARDHIASAKHWSDKPENIIKGFYVYTVTDFNSVTYIFGDSEKAADEYFSGDAYDWFRSDYTPDISSVTSFLDAECFGRIWDELMGSELTVLNEDEDVLETVEVTPELRATKGDKWLERRLDDESDASDGLQEVREKLAEIYRDADTQASENEFGKSLMETIKDAFGESHWNDKNQLVFHVPWSTMLDYVKKTREEHSFDEMGMEDFLRYGVEKHSLPDTDLGHVDKAAFKEVFMDRF